MFFGQTFLNFPSVDYLHQQLSFLIQNNNLQTDWPVLETNYLSAMQNTMAD